MTHFTYVGTQYTLNSNESILDCLLRNGVEYPHSCQAGVCQFCLIKGTGQIDTAWQEGLQDTLKAQGYFLACLAKPNQDLDLSPLLADECSVQARILALTQLNHNVLQVKLSVENLAPWAPGQYLNLVNLDGVIRSYSIANLPLQDGFIELHIKLQSLRLMSSWLQEKAQVNDLIQIRGPLGKCFYFNPQKLAYPMLLAGTGTGLAPLLAIIRDALLQKHSGSITLIHGAVTEQDLYYQNELNNLAATHPQFHYETSVLKMAVFCAGVPSSHIFSDAFLSGL